MTHIHMRWLGNVEVHGNTGGTNQDKTGEAKLNRMHMRRETDKIKQEVHDET